MTIPHLLHLWVVAEQSILLFPPPQQADEYAGPAPVTS